MNINIIAFICCLMCDADADLFSLLVRVLVNFQTNIYYLTNIFTGSQNEPKNMFACRM